MSVARRLTLATALALLALPATGDARDRNIPTGTRADLFAKVVDCRSITDDTRRLACFDASVAALDQAEKADQVVIMDRNQVREARRSLFGFSLPRIKLFGGNGDKDEVDHIDTAVTSATRDENGALVFTTTEGARWHQIDDRPTFGVKSGTKVTIQKAALGSYFAKLAGTTSVRVKREN